MGLLKKALKKGLKPVRKSIKAGRKPLKTTRKVIKAHRKVFKNTVSKPIRAGRKGTRKVTRGVKRK